MANTVPLKDLIAGTTTHPAIGALLEGLRERGWIPGKNVEMVWRSAEGDYSRQPRQARELAESCDIIVVYAAALGAAMSATKTVPIVMATSAVSGPLRDDEGNLRIASLARPGSNVTGLTGRVGREILGKRLELLKAAAPKVRRLAFLTHESSTIGPLTRKLVEGLSLEVASYAWKSELDKLEPSFAQMSRDRVDAVFVEEVPSAHLQPTQKAIHALAERHRMAVLHEVLAAVDSGGLMAYGPDINKLYRRAPHYIDLILRGAKPGDIPIEQPTDFELRVNLTAAKAIGLQLPQALLVQATRVIE
jgi:putative tryptophan/tyrosine transport system substrate-binding protein